MALILSDDEALDIEQLKLAGVLQPVNRGMMDEAKHGTIIVPCADGHHFHDLFSHHLRLCGHEEHEDDLMHHPLALNGGALLLARQSPLRRLAEGVYAPDDEVLLRHLEGSIKLKRPHAIILYAHAPCGMARMYGLPIMNEFRLLADAKQRVREMAAALGVKDVRAWFHVFGQDGKRNTYHFRRAQWDVFCAGHELAA